MRLSDDGVAMIAASEGFGPHAYLDPVGVWTIGFGSTKGVRSGQTITRQAALRRLKAEVASVYGKAINGLPVPRELNQNQYDALVSFVYNVGPGAVGPTSSVGRYLRLGQYRNAAQAILAWNKGTVNGRLTVLPGLVTRRQAERKLFLTPVPRSSPAQWLTKAELRDIRRLDAIRDGSRKDPGVEEAAIVARLTLKRKQIYHLAGEHGDGRGWEYANRRARYRSIFARVPPGA